MVQLIPGAGDMTARVIGGSAESAVAGRHALDARWRAIAADRAKLVVATIGGDPASQTVDDLARAWSCAARVVAPGGAIALLCAAGPELGEGLQRAGEFSGPAAALAALHAHPPQNFPAAYQWLRAAERARLYLLSAVPGEQVESVFVTPLEKASQVQRLVDAAPSCLVLPDAHRLLAAVADKE